MFKTHESMSVPLMRAFSSQHSYWTMVERDAKTSWFHVTVRYRVEGHRITRTFMPDNAELLLQLLSEKNGSLQVLDLQVMTPPAVNQLGRWSMEPLAKIELAMGDEDEEVLIYTTAEGHVYLDPPQEGLFDPLVCQRSTLYFTANH